MLGPLALVLQGADTLGRALLDASRYLFVHSPNYQLVLEPFVPGAHDRTLRFDVQVDPDVPYRQLIDGCLSSLVTLARTLSGMPFAPPPVALPHTPVASRRTYEDVFRSAVVFEQSKAALYLGDNVLATRLAPVRPELRRIALAYISDRYPTTGTSFSAQVRALACGTVGTSKGTKAEIAHLLGLHPRTLQRRLNVEGTTFEEIRDGVRRSATARFLRETTLPLSQTAHVLGFSEYSAMSRKVRQWFGMTPTQIRESIEPGAGGSRRRPASTDAPGSGTSRPPRRRR